MKSVFNKNSESHLYTQHLQHTRTNYTLCGEKPVKGAIPLIVSDTSNLWCGNFSMVIIIDTLQSG